MYKPFRVSDLQAAAAGGTQGKMKRRVSPVVELLNVFVIIGRVVKMLSLINKHAWKDCRHL